MASQCRSQSHWSALCASAQAPSVNPFVSTTAVRLLQCLSQQFSGILTNCFQQLQTQKRGEMMLCALCVHVIGDHLGFKKNLFLQNSLFCKIFYREVSLTRMVVATSEGRITNSLDLQIWSSMTILTFLSNIERCRAWNLSSCRSSGHLFLLMDPGDNEYFSSCL